MTAADLHLVPDRDDIDKIAVADLVAEAVDAGIVAWLARRVTDDGAVLTGDTGLLSGLADAVRRQLANEPPAPGRFTVTYADNSVRGRAERLQERSNDVLGPPTNGEPDPTVAFTVVFGPDGDLEVIVDTACTLLDVQDLAKMIAAACDTGPDWVRFSRGTFRDNRQAGTTETMES